MAVMSSEPGGAQLALTAGSWRAGIYYTVKPVLSEHARKRWKRLVSRKDRELGHNLGNILEKPVQSLPGMLGGVHQYWFGGTGLSAVRAAQPVHRNI